MDQDLRLLLSRSDKVLSISEKMSAVFGDRYGVTFEAIANGVDPDTYRAACEAAKPEKSRRKEVVLRYCGALAKDMTFQTLVDVARAVDALQGELPMRLEVYTMPAWRRPFEEAVAGLRGITISDAVFGDGFPSLLAEADVLVLAYNFDEDSLRYIGLSMPNKLPEYLASGAAVLAVGPREANGIDYVLSRRSRLLRYRARSREAGGGPPASRHRLGLQERTGREGAGLGVRASRPRATSQPAFRRSSGRRQADPPRGSRSWARTRVIRRRASTRPRSSHGSSRRWNVAVSSSTSAPIMDPR